MQTLLENELNDSRSCLHQRNEIKASGFFSYLPFFDLGVKASTTIALSTLTMITVTLHVTEGQCNHSLHVWKHQVSILNKLMFDVIQTGEQQ